MSPFLTAAHSETALGIRHQLHHLGVILDGNRRWAAAHGTSVQNAYRRGARKFGELLTWCEQAGVPHVTAWAMSADNLRRPAAQTAPLMDAVAEGLRPIAAAGRWRLHLIGELDLLPPRHRTELLGLVAATAGARGGRANIALAYDGRLEILSALRRALDKSTSHGAGEGVRITPDLLARHLYTADQPDIDLVIRTSGERRLSGFLLWQAAQAELHFCDKNWPDFDREDFASAVQDFSRRVRRFGL
jgi:short-chain Z-isoprenyl diphosphate synthase